MMMKMSKASVTAIAATAATAMFAGAASAIPVTNPAVGPSYNCMAPAVQKQPLAQLICANPAVSKAEVSYVIAYSALRQTSSDAERTTMRAEADAFTRRTTEECGIQPTGYLGGRTPTAAEASCLLDHFSAERSRLLMRLGGAAREEATLSPEQTMTIQALLKNKGFLAANEAIDGVFGPATREAIGNWQRSSGQPSTGFGSAALLAQLEGLPAAAPAPVYQSQPVGQPATFSAVDIPQIVDAARSNEVRFNRDYKGRSFHAVMPLRSVSEAFISGGYRVSVGVGFRGADCTITDPASIARLANWNKGQSIEISGTIRDTIMGDLQLSPCTLRSLNE